jgi:hypothetical protein
MTTALEMLKAERRTHEIALNALNGAIDLLEASGKPAKPAKRHLSAAARARIVAGAKKMWRERRAKAKAAKAKAKAQ